MDAIKEPERKKTVKKIYNIIIAICVIGIIASAIYIVPKLFEQYKAEKDFTGLKTGGINLEELHKKNKDIVGWIKVDNTKIDYPVMQTTSDPLFYLRKNFKKEYSTAGTPFLDAYSILGKSRNYLIYGHNMKSGTMFHDLIKYDNKYYKKHKYLSFDTLREGKARYEVVAAFKTETYNFPYHQYSDIKTVETYNEYVEQIKSHNELSTNIDLKFEKDQLVTLSTCSYHVSGKAGRMVVVAKKLIDQSDRDLNPVWEEIKNTEEKKSEGVDFD